MLPCLPQESLMKNRRTLLNNTGFDLVQVDTVTENGNVIRASYEVVEPSEDVIGRFGSLSEAMKFMDLLCNLDQKEQVL